jgi:nitrite reductase (NADH) small subunit
MSSETLNWTPICALEDIVPDTGVAARVQGQHVAVFRLADGRLFAIDNIDPKAGASVLARGLVGNLGEHVVVASPLYKHHYDLHTGKCLELPEYAVRTHAVRVEDGHIQLALSAAFSNTSPAAPAAAAA